MNQEIADDIETLVKFAIEWSIKPDVIEAAARVESYLATYRPHK